MYLEDSSYKDIGKLTYSEIGDTTYLDLVNGVVIKVETGSLDGYGGAEGYEEISPRNGRFSKEDGDWLNVAEVMETISNSVSPTRSEVTTTQDLATGALSYETIETSDFKVLGAYFVFDGTTTQTITLTYNSVKIFEEEVTPSTTVFIDLDQIILASLGKQLTVACTNTGTPAITVILTLDVEVM